MFRYIYIDQNATFRETVTLNESLTGVSLYGSVKKHYQSETSIEFEINVDNNETGKFTFELTSTQTSSLDFDKTYVYDIIAEYTNGDVKRIREGNAVVRSGVTRNVD